jgi:hypothetical protein
MNPGLLDCVGTMTEVGISRARPSMSYRTWVFVMEGSTFDSWSYALGIIVTSKALQQPASAQSEEPPVSQLMSLC